MRLALTALRRARITVGLCGAENSSLERDSFKAAAIARPELTAVICVALPALKRD
jgi:hypothetical protein